MDKSKSKRKPPPPKKKNNNNASSTGPVPTVKPPPPLSKSRALDARPANAAPPPPPPPPSPPSQEDIDNSFPRPQDYAPKEVTGRFMGVQTATREGDLCAGFVTISLLHYNTPGDAWAHAERDFSFLLAMLAQLPAVHSVNGVIEVFGGKHASSATKPRGKKQKTKDGLPVEDTEMADDEPASESISEADTFKDAQGRVRIRFAKVTYDTAGQPIRKSMRGFPHMHFVTFWFKGQAFRLDLDFIKLRIRSLYVMPEGVSANRKPDINVQRRNINNANNEASNITRLLRYIYKSVNCPAKRELWKRYVNPDAEAPLPRLEINKRNWSYDTNDQRATCSKRLALNFYLLISDYCTTSLRLQDIPDHDKPMPLLTEDTAPNAKIRDMREFAALLFHARVYVGQGSDELRGKFFMLENRNEYNVLATYKPPMELNDLHEMLTSRAGSRAEYFFAMYKKDMLDWCLNATQFKLVVGPTNYHWIELSDAFYNIRTNQFHYKFVVDSRGIPQLDDADDLVPNPEPFANRCYRSYAYNSKHIQNGLHPGLDCYLDTIRLIASGAFPELKDSSSGSWYISHRAITAKQLLLLQHRLLRSRKEKRETVVYYGDSNRGKSTLLSWVEHLLHEDTIASIDDSKAALAQVHSHTMLITCDEFDKKIVTRSGLLLLLSNDKSLNKRRLHQNGKRIAHPMAPVFIASSERTEFEKDKSDSMENRCEYLKLTAMIHNPSQARQREMEEAHLFICHYLHCVAANPDAYDASGAKVLPPPAPPVPTPSVAPPTPSPQPETTRPTPVPAPITPQKHHIPYINAPDL